MSSLSHGEAVEPRPLLRGVLHEIGLGVALVVGTLLIVGADGGKPSVAAAVFAGSVALCLALSTLYHRVTWRPRARLWMRRMDHAGVFVLIAGTYTAVGLLSLHGVLQMTVLPIVWTGAALAVLAKVVWVHSPKWVSVVLGVALGWVGIVALPQLMDTAGPAAVALLAAGGVAYTLGAVVYGTKRPNPSPRWFGFHEIFHALTVVGFTCHYVAAALAVLR